MAYKYRAVSNNGEITEGIFEGESEEEVLSMLKSNAYIPILIEEIENKPIKNIMAIGCKVKNKDIAIFCRQFYTMINAGLGIVNCLHILEKQTENKILKTAIRQVGEDVQKGMIFSEAMKKHEKVFPKLLISMIEAGEASGTLDIIMSRMATYYEKEAKIENKIKGALTYPIILMFVSIAVIIFLLTVIMPAFISMFESSGDVILPGPTRILLNISNTMKSYWYIYLMIILAIVLWVKFYSRTRLGRLFFDTIKIKFPIFKNINIKIITSRFTRTFSILLSSGISLIQSLELASRVIGNMVVVEGLKKATDDIRKGVPLSSTIKKIGVFPPMVDSMIKVGEESGCLDEVLLKTADFYDEEVKVSLQKITTLIEPVLIVVMAFIIGFIVISMAMPMLDIIDTIEM